MNWQRCSYGGWLSKDGVWYIRGPIFGKEMFWIYRRGHRYTPTGRYVDAVSFRTRKAARAYIEGLGPLTK